MRVIWAGVALPRPGYAPALGERRLAVLLDKFTRYLTREIPATNGLKRLLVFRPK